MNDQEKADAITDLIAGAFPNEKERVEPTRIEELLRPFAPVTAPLRERVQDLLRNRCGWMRSLDVDHWMEANVAVSGEEEGVEETINFLLRDTCTCVLAHLPAAVQHATKPVDPRILGLLRVQQT